MIDGAKSTGHCRASSASSGVPRALNVFWRHFLAVSEGKRRQNGGRSWERACLGGAPQERALLHGFCVSFANSACERAQEFAGKSRDIIDEARELTLTEHDNFHVSFGRDGRVARRPS